MNKTAKTLLEAFNEEAGDEAFGKTHKAQAEALRKILGDINAEGTFAAALAADRGLPVLEFTHQAEGITQRFAVGFGHDGFSGSKTIKLAALPFGEQVGDKKNGYMLNYASDAEQFLKDLGEALGKGHAEAKAGAALLKAPARKP